jgi:hypothetical protein
LNGDGVLTLEEWQQCLEPKIKQQKQFVLIMADLKDDKKIDPLNLEEEILDSVFSIKRLKKEIA